MLEEGPTAVRSAVTLERLKMKTKIFKSIIFFNYIKIKLIKYNHKMNPTRLSFLASLIVLCHKIMFAKGDRHLTSHNSMTQNAQINKLS